MVSTLVHVSFQVGSVARMMVRRVSRSAGSRGRTAPAFPVIFFVHVLVSARIPSAVIIDVRLERFDASDALQKLWSRLHESKG